MGGFNAKGRQILSTCKDCTDRFLGCHDKCDKYKQAKEQWLEHTAKVRTEKQKLNAVTKYQIDAVRRMKHK